MNHELWRSPIGRLALGSLLWFAAISDLPAEEAREVSSGGIFELSVWSVTPRNKDLDYAFVDQTAGLSGGGRLQTLTCDGDNDLTLRTGWRFGASGSPTLIATLWETDVRVLHQTGDLPQQVGALLASPDFAIGRSFVDSASASSRLRATLADFDFGWSPDSTSRATFGFVTGIRLFRYEESTVVTYRVDSSGQQLEEFVNTRSDADGIGPKLGISFEYRAHRKLAIRTGIDVAIPLGEIESLTTDTVLANGGFLQAAAADRAGTEQAFLQIGGEIGLVGSLGTGWTASLSYRFLHWSDVAASLRFVDDLSPNTAIESESDVVFAGPRLALGYSF